VEMFHIFTATTFHCCQVIWTVFLQLTARGPMGVANIGDWYAIQPFFGLIGAVHK